MPIRTNARVAAGSAVLFVALFAVGFAIQPTPVPDSNDSALKIITYYADHRSTLLVGDFLLACAGIPFLVLLGVLHRLMRRVEGEGGWLATTMLAGGITSGAAFTVAVGLLITLAYRPVQSPGVARMLLDAGFVNLNLAGIALGVFVAAVSAAALLSRFVPAWVGWLGVPVAAAQVVGAGALARGDGPFSPQGIIPLAVALSFAVWTLALALGLALRSRTPAAQMTLGE